MFFLLEVFVSKLVFFFFDVNFENEDYVWFFLRRDFCFWLLISVSFLMFILIVLNDFLMNVGERGDMCY